MSGQINDDVDYRDCIEELEHVADANVSFKNLLFPLDSGVEGWRSADNDEFDPTQQSGLHDSQGNEVPMESFPRIKVEYPDLWEKEAPKKTSKKNIAVVLLIVTGLLGGSISVSMDIAISKLRSLNFDLSDAGNNTASRFFLWLVYPVILLWIDSSMTSAIAPAASGSGCPELRSVVQGVHLKYFLSWRALFVKIIGTTLSLGSGMILGKEGPFIHLCCCLANCLVSTPIFRRIRQNRNMLQIIIVAACATGVASHFGAPIGGVLFTVEITTSYYPIRNYPYSYLGAIVGAGTWRYLWNAYFRNDPSFRSLILVTYSQLVYGFGLLEIVLFAILGIFCGLTGAFFIKWNAFLYKHWRKVTRASVFAKSPFVLCFFIASFTVLVTFPDFLGSFASLSAVNITSDMFLAGTGPYAWDSPELHAHDWNNRNIYINLVILFFSRLILIPASIILPIPCGLFIPTLSLGSFLGRIVGQGAYDIFQGGSALFEKNPIAPGLFAIAGAAGVTGAVTQTLSTAVILFEITGNITALIPVLICVYVGAAVTRRITTVGIYESLAKLKGLHFIPDLRHSFYPICARDIVDKNCPYVTRDFSLEMIENVLKNSKKLVFPVVTDDENKLLVGTVDRTSLMDYERTQQIIIKPTPIRFSEEQMLSHIHTLFVTMKLTQGYVTNAGMLIGIITRRKLQKAIYFFDEHHKKKM